ncbi:MAG: GspH/FimT family pseudopilin [Nitrospinales bacterium]
MFRSRIKTIHGFTLIEILSVIVIMGIVAAVAIPSFNPSGINVGTAAQTIETDIRFVQELAMSRNPRNVGEIGITFTVGSSSYSIVDPDTDPDVNITTGGIFDTTRTLPDGVTIISASPSTRISFNKFGEPETGAANFVLQIDADGETKTITVEQHTGKVSIS